MDKKTTESVCRWCGETYEQHEDFRAEGQPVPKMPCTGLKAYFLAKSPPSQSNEVSTECKCHCHICQCEKDYAATCIYNDTCTHCSPKTAPQGSTDEFMELVILFKGWFADEELEVTDYVLGRMAARLQTYLESRDK